MPTFLVPVMIEVSAKSKTQAMDEVSGLMDYAFEVSNDKDRFKSWQLGPISDVQKQAPKAKP